MAAKKATKKAASKKKTTKKVVAKKVAPKKVASAKKAPTKKVAPKKSAKGMTASIYGVDAKEKGTLTLPEAVFDAAWNADLVHQVVMAQQGNARVAVAHVKDRSDVRGGGRKPWRQKGTGRARHGSRRSPIWRGGGITHGPTKDKDYSRKTTKKMRSKALYSTLSRKFRDGEILFVDALTFTEPKTRDAKAILTALSGISGYEKLDAKKNNVALIALSEHDEMVKKSFNNFGNIEVEEVRNLNPVDLLTYTYVIVVSPEQAVEILKGRGNIAG